ncbi:4Fe-4S binding protein [Lolliginicoccus levis]|uniref:4Fe-4S binding protein n=1 Tax=Lolliginicoccus levis TaxID=2919542 RepID=UPI00241EF5B1|nr:4Fe-4S binding protein [Lolliginicoccus levis]
MAYVITRSCCNDASCVPACPVDCIHPALTDPLFATAEMLYIEPDACIDCGACVDECPVSAIFPEDSLPVEQEPFIDINAAYFDRHPYGAEPTRPERPPALRFAPGPLRVAIVGTGPAGLYLAEQLLGLGGVEVELFDRLPTPFGLMRAGIAPDHADTQQVVEMFAPLLGKPALGLHLDVEVGTHLAHQHLLDHHHAVVYAVGAGSPRQLGIAGEQLPGSVAATDFVAWYNGHPDHASDQYRLEGDTAVVIGTGNVALDVARILAISPEALAGTDIADPALEALQGSGIREVLVLGRRGLLDSTFTLPELVGMGNIPGASVVIDPADTEVDGATSEWLRREAEPEVAQKLAVARQHAQRATSPGDRTIRFQYRTTPLRILGDDHVTGIEVREHRPGESPRDRIIDASLVLRAVGYQPGPPPGLPVDDSTGTAAHEHGRVATMSGTYVVGWAKRGPRGPLGYNRADAIDTMGSIVDDANSGALDRPIGGREQLHQMLAERRPGAIGLAGWRAIDNVEKTGGRGTGRPRSKITTWDALREAARAR